MLFTVLHKNAGASARHNLYNAEAVVRDPGCSTEHGSAEIVQQLLKRIPCMTWPDHPSSCSSVMGVAVFSGATRDRNEVTP